MPSLADRTQSIDSKVREKFKVLIEKDLAKKEIKKERSMDLSL